MQHRSTTCTESMLRAKFGKRVALIFARQREELHRENERRIDRGLVVSSPMFYPEERKFVCARSVD